MRAWPRHRSTGRASSSTWTISRPSSRSAAERKFAHTSQYCPMPGSVGGGRRRGQVSRWPPGRAGDRTQRATAARFQGRRGLMRRWAWLGGFLVALGCVPPAAPRVVNRPRPAAPAAAPPRDPARTSSAHRDRSAARSCRRPQPGWQPGPRHEGARSWTLAETIDVTLAVIGQLTRIGLRHLVVGTMVSPGHGVPR